MEYLIIMAVVAAAGLLWLWLSRRRGTDPVKSVNEFQSSMEKISPSASERQPASERRRRRP